MPDVLRYVIRENGLNWVLRRSWYELGVKGGLLAWRFPAREWAEREAACAVDAGAASHGQDSLRLWREAGGNFWMAVTGGGRSDSRVREHLGEGAVERLRSAADAFLAGRTCYFSNQSAETGLPPDWRSNPFTKGAVDDARHWSRLPMWSPEYGDIKYVWEPGRFASAYLLARAYRWLGEERYAEGFWQLVDSFYEHNPPNTGPHWKCGQEMALRIMACCFGLYATADSPSLTPERFTRLLRIVATHADRIAANHVYAHLQQNNHAMSEGVGLFAAGVLFPFLKRADRWRQRGQEILEKEARLLIRADGTFNQKSHNYHRLMVHDYLYALRLAEVNGIEFAGDLRDRIASAIDYMCGVLDTESGMVPNFGANDGALILPLNTCDFTDFRPVCQAGRYWLERKRWLDPGPWDEDLYWLFGADAPAAEATKFEQADVKADTGGCYTLRGDHSWVFTHCEAFGSRPSHADALHVDLWWRGLNIACDAGTYLYYAEPPWNNGLAGTAVHNTVCVDGMDQLERGPRFMWTRWHDARTLRTEHGDACLWEGEHDGYMRLGAPVRHRRTVLQLLPGTWTVVDSLTGDGTHRLSLHWLLADLPHEFDADGSAIGLKTPRGDYFVSLLPVFGGTPEAECSLVRADPAGTRGWVSRFYGRREPALSLRLDVESSMPGRFVTVFSEQAVAVERDSQQMLVSCEDEKLVIKADVDAVQISGGGRTIDIK